VRGIADDGDASFRVSGRRILTKVENCPLRTLVSYSSTNPSHAVTYNVEVLIRQLQQAHHIIAVASEVLESVLAVCWSRQLVRVLPRLVCRPKGNDVESFAVLDWECQDVSVGSQL
jgi:hypothetical protein